MLRCPPSSVTCAVCHRSRMRGAYSHAGDVFICIECRAGARQFIEIQDSFWRDGSETSQSSDKTDKPPDL